MARYAYPSIDNLTGNLAKEMRERIGPGRGNVWRMLLLTPDAAEKFIAFSEEVRNRNAIPSAIRELMILRVGHLCNAPYEVHHHKRIGRSVGLSEVSIAASAIGSTATGIDRSEKFVLGMVDELVENKQLCQATFDQAVAEYGVRTVADMVLMVGFYTMASMFLNSFGVEVEQPPIKD